MKKILSLLFIVHVAVIVWSFFLTGPSELFEAFSKPSQESTFNEEQAQKLKAMLSEGYHHKVKNYNYYRHVTKILLCIDAFFIFQFILNTYYFSEEEKIEAKEPEDREGL